MICAQSLCFHKKENIKDTIKVFLKDTIIKKVIYKWQ